MEIFLTHPREHNQTYFQHLIRAWSLALHLAKGSVALLVHGLVPGWFQTTGTEAIRSAYDAVSPKRK